MWEGIWEAPESHEASGETSGRHLRDIWEASERHLGARGQRRPRGGCVGKCAQTTMFFLQKWRDRPFHLRKTSVTSTLHRNSHGLGAGAWRERAAEQSIAASLPKLLEVRTPQCKHCLGNGCQVR